MTIVVAARATSRYGGQMVDRAALPALESGSTLDLISDAVLDGMEFVGMNLSGIRASHARLLEVAITDCSADDLETPRLDCVDTYMASLQVQTWRCTGGSWRDATFERLRVGAWLADGAELLDVTISDCKVDLLSLRGAVAQRVTLRDCRIESLDLTAARVTDVTIEGGVLGELLTADGNITKLDVSRTELHMVGHAGSLRGLVMSQDQVKDLAFAFATHLGVEIAEG